MQAPTIGRVLHARRISTVETEWWPVIVTRVGPETFLGWVFRTQDNGGAYEVKFLVGSDLSEDGSLQWRWPPIVAPHGEAKDADSGSGSQGDPARDNS